MIMEETLYGAKAFSNVWEDWTPLQYVEIIKEVDVIAKTTPSMDIPGLTIPSLGRNNISAALKRDKLPWNGSGGDLQGLLGGDSMYKCLYIIIIYLDSGVPYTMDESEFDESETAELKAVEKMKQMKKERDIRVEK
jgi:hypothetical protein